MNQGKHIKTLAITAIAASAAALAGTSRAAPPQTRHVVSNDEKKVFIDDQIRFAEGLASRKHYDLAIEEYKRLIRRFKDDPLVAEAWARLAATLAAKGDFDAAFATFDEFFKRFPDSKIFHATKLRRATALRSFGDKKKSYAELEALSKNPKAPEVVRDAAIYYAAKFHKKDGETEAAERCLRALAAKKATESPKHDFRAHAAMELASLMADKGDFEHALELLAPLASAKALSNDIKGHALFAVGALLLKKGDEKGAAAKFAEFEMLFPGHRLVFDATRNRLNALFKLGEYPQVVIEADKALKTPGTPPAAAADIRCVKAAALRKMGFQEKALAEFEKVIASPAATAATKRLAVFQSLATMLDSGDIKKAERAVEKILDKVPMDNTLARDAAVLLSQKTPPETAEKLLRRAAEKLDISTREGADVRLRLANLLLSQGKTDDALPLFNLVSEKGAEKDRPFADLAAAAALERKNEIEAARKRLEKIVRSKNAGQVRYPAMLRLATILLKNEKEWDAAAAYLDRIKKEAPGSPIAAEARFYQGYMAFHKKKLDKAVDAFHEILAPKTKATPAIRDAAKTYLAWALLKSGKTDKALETAAELSGNAISNAPPDCLEDLGGAAINTNPKLAKRCFDAMAAAKNPLVKQRGLLRSAELAVASGDAVAAIEKFKLAVDADADAKTTNLALVELGNILADRGNDDEAVLYLEKCLERPVDKNVSARARLALAKILSKKPDRLKVANRYAMSVFVLSPNNDTCAEAMLLSSEISIRENKLDEARSTFKEFRERFPKLIDSKRAKAIAKALDITIEKQNKEKK